MISDVTDRKKAEEDAAFLARATGVLNSSLDYHETLRSLADLIISGLADWCQIDLALDSETPRCVAIAHIDTNKRKFAEQLQERFPVDWSSSTGTPSVIRTGKSLIYSHITQEMLNRLAQSEEHLKMLNALNLRSVIVVPLISRGEPFGAITLVAAESGRRYKKSDLALAEELGRRAGQAIDNAFLYHQSQKAIQARDEFLSIASHELKTPLTSLKLQVQMRKRNLLRGDISFLTPDRFLHLLE